jgi:hypothetical protein
MLPAFDPQPVYITGPRGALNFDGIVTRVGRLREAWLSDGTDQNPDAHVYVLLHHSGVEYARQLARALDAPVVTASDTMRYSQQPRDLVLRTGNWVMMLPTVRGASPVDWMPPVVAMRPWAEVAGARVDGTVMVH